MIDPFTVEELALARQRDIRTEIAAARRAAAPQPGNSRRTLAAALAALARWLDPGATSQPTSPAPVGQR